MSYDYSSAISGRRDTAIASACVEDEASETVGAGAAGKGRFKVTGNADASSFATGSAASPQEGTSASVRSFLAGLRPATGRKAFDVGETQTATMEIGGKADATATVTGRSEFESGAGEVAQDSAL